MSNRFLLNGLKSCPLCGGQAVFTQTKKPSKESLTDKGYSKRLIKARYRVYCASCNTSTIAFDDPAQAVACWNRRLDPAVQYIPYIKGPWKYSKTDSGTYMIGSTNDQFELKNVICELYPMEMQVDDAVAEATARAITALPATIKQLQQAKQLLEEIENYDSKFLEKQKSYYLIVKKRQELQDNINRLLAEIQGISFESIPTAEAKTPKPKKKAQQQVKRAPADQYLEERIEMIADE